MMIEKQENLKVATLIDIENINDFEVIPEIFSYLESKKYHAFPRKVIISKLSQVEALTNLVKTSNLELIVSTKRLKPGKSKADKDKNKNNADFRIYLEAMDCLYNDNPDAFLIASSDDDFTELIFRLQKTQKHLIGVGSKNVTTKDYQMLFDEFIFTEDLIEAYQKRKQKVAPVENKSKSVTPKEKKENVKPSPKAKVIAKKPETDKDEKLKKTLNVKILEMLNEHSDQGPYYLAALIKDFKNTYPEFKTQKIKTSILKDLGYAGLIQKDEKGYEFIDIKKIIA